MKVKKYKRKKTTGLENNQSKLLSVSPYQKYKKFPSGAIYAKCILMGFIMHCSINLFKK